MTPGELAIFAAAFVAELAARQADAPEAYDATGPASEALAAGAAIEASLATDVALTAAVMAHARLGRMELDGYNAEVAARTLGRLRELLR